MICIRFKIFYFLMLRHHICWCFFLCGKPQNINSELHNKKTRNITRASSHTYIYFFKNHIIVLQHWIFLLMWFPHRIEFWSITITITSTNDITFRDYLPIAIYRSSRPSWNLKMYLLVTAPAATTVVVTVAIVKPTETELMPIRARIQRTTIVMRPILSSLLLILLGFNRTQWVWSYKYIVEKSKKQDLRVVYCNLKPFIKKIKEKTTTTTQSSPLLKK